MSEFIWVYAYTILATLSKLTTIFMAISGVIWVFFFGITYGEKNIEGEPIEIVELIQKLTRPLLIGFVLMILLNVLVPTKERITLIIGGGLAWKTTQIDGIQNLPENLVNSLNDFLEGTKINTKEK